MNQDYTKIEGKVIKTRGIMSYICEKVIGNYAFIRVKGYNDITLGYEVMKLRTYPITDKYKPGGIRFPSDEDFGKYGWYYKDKDKALTRFAMLVYSNVPISKY